MKILAIRSAKSIWLTTTAFINPGGRYLYAALGSVKDRYGFLKSPLDKKLPPEVNEGYKFEFGAFNGKSGQIEIVQFVIHTDGLVVETRSSTDDGEDFLINFFDWGGKELGLAKPNDIPIKKVYSSEINFTLSRKPIFFNPKLSKFFDAANNATRDESGSDFLQLTLGTDQTRSKNQRTFSIAREVDTEIDAKRYYSFASTTTAEHIAILEKLEKLSI